MRLVLDTDVIVAALPFLAVRVQGWDHISDELLVAEPVLPHGGDRLNARGRLLLQGTAASNLVQVCCALTSASRAFRNRRSGPVPARAAASS